MRIVVAGAVGSTLLTLEALVRHKADVVGVLQLRPESAHTVTGFALLEPLATKAGPVRRSETSTIRKSSSRSENGNRI